MATKDTANGQPQATDGAVLLQGFDGILAACGGKPTRRWSQGGDEMTVEANGQNQQETDGPADSMKDDGWGELIAHLL